MAGRVARRLTAGLIMGTADPMMAGLAVRRHETDCATDLHQWTIEQGRRPRRWAVNELDYDNLAEEIESVGRSERREIRSRPKILLIRLLKWRYRPEKQSKRWRASVSEARQRIDDVDNPSLRLFLAQGSDERVSPRDPR